MNKIIISTILLSACASEGPSKPQDTFELAPSTQPAAVVEAPPTSKSAASATFASVFGADAALGKEPENILGERPSGADGGFGLGLVGAGTCDCEEESKHSKNTIGPGDKIKPGKGDPLNSPLVEGKATVSAGLSTDVVRRVIRRAMPGIKFCYEQALESNPTLAGLEGKVVIDFTILDTGVVSSATATRGINPDIDACIVKKIAVLSFPEPSDGKTVAVTYPFLFLSTKD